MRHWFKEGMIYGVSATVSKFRGVFLAPIFTRLLGPEKYGLLDLSVTLSAIFLLLAEMQMVSGFGRSYYESKKRGDRDTLTGTVLLYYLLSAITLVLLVWFFRRPLLAVLPGFYAPLLVPILAGILPRQINDLCLFLLRYEHRPKQFFVLSQLNIWLAAIMAVVAVFVFHVEVMGILVAFAISAVICAVVSLYFIIRITGVRLGFSHLGGMLAYSVPIVPAVIGSWLQSYASRFFIVAVLSMSLLGIYSLAVKVAAIMLLFAASFRRVWGPYAMEQYTVDGSERKFVMALNLYLFISFVGLAFVGSAAPVLVPLMAGPEFLGAAPYVSVLAAAYVWEGLFSILASGNAWARKTYCNTAGCLIGGGLNIVLLWRLLPHFGLPLVPFAFLAGMILRAVITMWTAQRNHHIPYDGRAVVLAFVTSIAYSLACYVVSRMEMVGAYGPTIVSLVLCGTSLIILWLAIMTPEEQRRVRALFSLLPWCRAEAS